MTNIILYTKENCPACNRSKKLLNEFNYPFTEIVVGKDISRDQILEKYPDQKTVPIIIINDNKISGFTELQVLLETKKIELL